jgi:hypothetical protein
MNYTYQITDYSTSQRGWIKYIYKATNLEANYAAQFTEAHVTIPKVPGDKQNWVTLPHITIVTVRDYRYHWYILLQKVTDQRRMEQIGTGNKSVNKNWNSTEKELVDRLLKDIKEKNWC